MKIYWKQFGGHIHMRVFMNGKCGDLVCDEREWKEFQSMFSVNVTWIPE